MALELDVQRGQRISRADNKNLGRSTNSNEVKEVPQIMGNFAIIKYDLLSESLYQMKQHDQEVIRE